MYDEIVICKKDRIVAKMAVVYIIKNMLMLSKNFISLQIETVMSINTGSYKDNSLNTVAGIFNSPSTS